MKSRFFTLLLTVLVLLSFASAEIIKQQSFEGEASDTWGYTLTPGAYYNTGNYSIWDRDNDLLPRMEPLPDEDGEYLFVMENTGATSTELHKFVFDTVDLSSYTGDLSVHFYYYTFYYNTNDGSWSGTPDSIGYYVEYNNGSDWSDYVPLSMGTNEWTQISIDIPDTAQYLRLSIVGKNSVWQEIGAFDYIYLLEEIGEPTNHVTGLTVSETTENSLTVTWNDNDGAQPAENFLVKIAQGSSPSAPVDGTEEHPSATVKQVASGVGTATFNGLASNTSYTVAVYPYTNLDVFIDYKTDGTVPTVTASTQDTPTPISLAEFSAQISEEGVEINWTTESESENSGFIVYRNDEAIAFVEGAGTSSETRKYSYLDKNAVPGCTYTYFLADLSFDNDEVRHEDLSVTLKVTEETIAEKTYLVEPAYPNPFNPQIKLDYQLNVSNHVEILVRNMRGEKIISLQNGFQEAGVYSLNWNAEKYESGIYFLSISVGSSVETQKLLLVK